MATAMILAIATTRRPATDLGHLLPKHPDRVHTTPLTLSSRSGAPVSRCPVRCAPLALGRGHVVYPEATPDRCRQRSSSTLTRLASCVLRAPAREARLLIPACDLSLADPPIMVEEAGLRVLERS